MYTEELVNNTIGRQYWIYKDDSFYQQRIAGAGPYQKQNLLRLRELKPDARTILDCGMNIGMNSIEYATWAKTVHGFEPTPQTYSMATRNIDLAKAQTDADMIKPWHEDSSFVVTGDITPHNIGLGDVAGTFDILIKKDNAGHNHIENIHVPLVSGKARSRKIEPEKVTVDVKTVDSFDFQDVDIIKIDTEGYEFPIVKGAEQTIMKWKPIVQLEMVAGQPERFGFSCQEIYDWFLSRDFVITLSDGTDAGNTWDHYTKKMERFFIHKDLLATHPVFHDTKTVPSSVEKEHKAELLKAKQEQEKLQEKLVNSLFEETA
jgi:FkbM family methyltransferase